MRLGKWIECIYDQKLDLQERMYFLITGMEMMVLLIVIIAGLLTREPLISMLVWFGCFVLFEFLLIIAVRYHKFRICAVILAFVTVAFLLPFSFFMGDGIYGGPPIWFVLCTLFICVTLSGRTQWTFLCLEFAVSASCYYLAYVNPEFVTKHSRGMIFRDSFASVVIVSGLTALLLVFEIGILRDALRQSEEQRREIDELNKAQNRFFSSMSHEIRTPLNTIIGLNEMILREEISDEVAEDASNVKSASRILLHLINDILDMARFEAGKMELTAAEYDLGKLLSEIVSMFWTNARDQKLDFHLDIDPEIPSHLYGDEVRIKQILINILNNAFKYTSEGSVTLSVQHRMADQEVILIFSVTDTGIGIKKENLPFVFHAFERANESDNFHIEGTGLGLAIVKQLVSLMGGTVSANSVYTKGTTFIIELPQIISGPGCVGELNLLSRIGNNSRENYNQSFEAPEAKILLVDDSKLNLEVVKKLLRDTKMEIDTAESGQEALAKTQKNTYDLIFMDHLMPEMDGIECLQRIRRQPGGFCKDTKVVALTANAGRENQALYGREGFDGYLVKPTSGEALEEECLRLLPSELVHVIQLDSHIIEGSVSWLTDKKKKKEIIITTDSIADLPKPILRQNDIPVIPHIIFTEEGQFMDGIEIESDGLLSYMLETGKWMETHAPEVEDYEVFFAEQLQKANNIIHISLSEHLRDSGLLRAKEAAKSFENVTVIDSDHLSSGEGLMVINACRMVREEMKPLEIVGELERYKPLVHTSFIVDDLNYLVRASQVKTNILAFSKTFMLHPVLVMKKGKLRIRNVFFGSRITAWKKYIRSEFKTTRAVDRSLLFITYVGLTHQDLEFIKEEVGRYIHFEEIIVQKSSPAITVNCGPGTFGLLYQNILKNPANNL